MKSELINKLKNLKKALRSLKTQLANLPGDRVSRKPLRVEAESIANVWVEELRSPLEYKIKVSTEIIKVISEQMKRLYVLSRPNNLKSSYIKTIDAILNKFDNKLILPVQQTPLRVDSILDLRNIIPRLSTPEESEYMHEAIECAASGYMRASVVMGWCAAIDRVQRKIIDLGLDSFNKTSKNLKHKSSGKWRKWNKEFSVTTLSELQAVFDTDLIVVIEGMGLIDANQAERLRTAFQYRNHSAHPGEAPIEDAHLVAFFADIDAIIFQNPTFK